MADSRELQQVEIIRFLANLENDVLREAYEKTLGKVIPQLLAAGYQIVDTWNDGIYRYQMWSAPFKPEVANTEPSLEEQRWAQALADGPQPGVVLQVLANRRDDVIEYIKTIFRPSAVKINSAGQVLIIFGENSSEASLRRLIERSEYAIAVEIIPATFQL